MTDTDKLYRVLARKYRPLHFDDLIGQDVLVRTLKNAIEGGRVAHAFMLTGIRGVGKTTTARIIAKSLNYTGADGKAGPTTGVTDDCEICRAISEDRHPDVLEMDAASRTGVNDIREILDGVRYAPASARYKIYIIDEVHMLSQSAFNALLKTLEEPPEHVKFIFATTEIRKVPVTILSRCQRFDLKRVPPEILRTHYKSLCDKESVEIEDGALGLIARAADGSVRDGLSLLDQAIALASGKITADQVSGMLGVADCGLTLDLLEKIFEGKLEEAFLIIERLYEGGADPVVLVHDLLEYVHVLSRIRAVPGVSSKRFDMDEEVQSRVSSMASKLSVPVLGRAWQILVKGAGEIAFAPDQQAAFEMLLIRLGYAADLPDPVDLLKKIQNGQGGVSVGAAPVSGGGSGSGNGLSSGRSGGSVVTNAAPRYDMQAETALSGMSEPVCLSDVVEILQEKGEVILAGQVFHYVHLVKMSSGKMEVSLESEAPPALSQNLGKVLSAACGKRWVIMVSSFAGEPTLAEVERREEEEKRQKILEMPLAKDIISFFPEAKIVKIHQKMKKDS